MFKKLREKFKNKAFSKVMLSLGLAGVSAGVLATGISLITPFPKAAPIEPIEEIWDEASGSFNPDTVNQLLSAISGGTATYDNMASIDEAATAKMTEADFESKHANTLMVDVGGLTWTTTYLSKDVNGNVILTLWLSYSSQLSGKTINGTIKFNSGGDSTWSSAWQEDNPDESYPSNMYGTSYIRSVVLNNGGKYATSGTSTIEHAQDSASIFATFTMKDAVDSLANFIIEPDRVPWQAQQSAKALGIQSYNLPNEEFAPATSGDQAGDYYSASYNYAEHDGYDAWKSDKLWLPSLSETGYSSSTTGIWKTNPNVREGDSVYSWLRSGYEYAAYSAYYLDPSGDPNTCEVDCPYAVRPAFHLNLTAVANSLKSDIWKESEGKFDKDTLQSLFDSVSGKTGAGFADVRALGKATRADSKIAGTTAAQMTQNNGGEEIVVTLGGLDWFPTYISTDNEGNTILTLWLTNNEQDAFASHEGEMGDYYGFVKGPDTGKVGLYSDWAADWSSVSPNPDDPDYNESNLYGASYIRAVTLNNGGIYAMSDDRMLSEFQPVVTSVFAKFTMAESPGSVTQFLVKPRQVEWQETLSAINSGAFPFNVSNDAWTQDREYFNIGSFNNELFNYTGKTWNDNWANDYIWLPGLAETGYSSDANCGLWQLSNKQRQNYDGSTESISGVQIGNGANMNDANTAYTYSWLRSGESLSASQAYSLSPSGYLDDFRYVNYSCAVRPALHLNLDAAAESAGIEVPPFTWADFAADAFANENDVDGSSEAQAYEIGSAEQLALLAKRVNDAGTNADWAKKYYKLTGDIFLAAHQWQPIGVSGSIFEGYFDGQNHTIYGLMIESDQQSQGLFGYCGGPTIQNLSLKSGQVNITAAGTSESVGVGSIIGTGNVVTLTNCSSNVVVNSVGNNVGGLVGYASCISTNCQYTGSVTGNENVGGLAGYSGLSVVQACITDCRVEGKANVGALMGAFGGGVTDCIARGTIVGPGNIFWGTNKAKAILSVPLTGAATACYFCGSANEELVLDTKNATACYAIINSRKLISTDLSDSSWANNWAVIPGLNGGLPVQKGLFWSASVAESTLEEIAAALSDFVKN